MDQGLGGSPDEAVRLLDEVERLARLGHWRWTIQADRHEWSAEACRIFGLGRAETGSAGAGPTLDAALALVHPDDRAITSACIKLAVETRKGCELTLRVIHPEDGLRHVVFRARCVLDDHGTVAGLSGTAQDVSDRMAAASALAASEQRFRHLIDVLPDTVLIHDAAGRVLDHNRRACDGLGYGADELTALTLDDLDGNDGTAAPAPDRRFRRKDGTVFPVELRRFALGDDVPDRLVTLARDVSQDRAAEAALESNRGFQEVLLDTIPSPIYWKGPDGRYRGCNRAFAAAAGLARPDVLGRTAFDLAPHNLADLDQRSDEALLAGRRAQVYESHFRYADGSVREALISKAAVPDPQDGQPIIVGAVVDIGPLKQSEQALRASEKRLRHLLETTPVGVAVIAVADGRVLTVNERLVQMLAVPRARLLAGPAQSLYAAPGTHDHVMRQIRSGGPIEDSEVQLARADGSPIWALMSAETGVFEDQDALIAWFYDITARKRAEEALDKAESTLLDILEASPVAVGILHEDGRPLYWNQLFFAIGAQRPDSFRGAGFRVLFRDEAEFDRLRAQLDRDGHVLNAEVELVSAEGEPNWALVTMRSMSFENQPAILIWVYDITRQKLQEAALAQARHDAEAGSRAKSAFLATMSHEIRTPMNGVVTMSELLARTALTLEQQDMNAVIRDSALCLLTIIEDILDFSKIESGQFRLDSIDFSLAQIVEGVIDLIAPRTAESGLELVHVVDPALPDHLCGDPHRLRQILVNLVGNAAKFTEAGGILVEVEGVLENPERVALRFAITDTGIGIPEDKQKQLFQPFVQADDSTMRKFGGTGLGLSICRALVQLMGGEIGLSSVPDRGSTFWFTVPMIVKEERRQRAEVDLSGKRVLVACPSALLADGLCRVLASVGAQTVVAAAGDRAVQVLDEAGKAGPAIDVMVIDSRLDLPSGPPRPVPAVRILPHARSTEIRAIEVDPEAATVVRPVKRDPLMHAVAVAAGCPLPARYGGPRRRAGEDVAVSGVLNRIAPDRAEALAAGALILVAEDNPTNQNVIRLLMANLGYAADLAGDGREAWHMLQERTYGLLLTDCHMPDVDGYELTAMIRRAEAGGGAHLPIIALTADALPGTGRHCLDAGMDDYLVKPVAMDVLDRAIQHWLPQAAGLRRSAGAPPETASAPAPPETVAELPHESLSASRSITTGPDDAMPILDLAYFRELLGGADEMIPPMLDTYLETTRTDLETLDHALDRGDLAVARKAAHAVAGASDTAGAKRLARLVGGIEKAIVARDLAAAITARDAIPSALAAVAHAVEALRGSDG